jgi:hypothetical protein
MYRKCRASWAAALLAAEDQEKSRQVNHADAPQDMPRRFGTDLARRAYGSIAPGYGGSPADCWDELQRVVNPDPIAEATLRASKAESIMLSQTFHYSVASVVSAVIGLLSAVVFTRLLSACALFVAEQGPIDRYRRDT